MQGSGKVRTGQRTVVRLTGFSEQEYGRIEGKVASISPVPDEKGNYHTKGEEPDFEPPSLVQINEQADPFTKAAIDSGASLEQRSRFSQKA